MYFAHIIVTQFQIDTRSDGKVTWDKFVSYLLIEFQDIDMTVKSQMLEAPLTDPPRLLRTRHRTPVCRITFCPEVLQVYMSTNIKESDTRINHVSFYFARKKREKARHSYQEITFFNNLRYIKKLLFF